MDEKQPRTKPYMSAITVACKISDVFTAQTKPKQLLTMLEVDSFVNERAPLPPPSALANICQPGHGLRAPSVKTSVPVNSEKLPSTLGRAHACLSRIVSGLHAFAQPFTADANDYLFSTCNEYFQAQSRQTVADWRQSAAGKQRPVAYVGFGGPFNFKLIAAAEPELALIIDRCSDMTLLLEELAFLQFGMPDPMQNETLASHGITPESVPFLTPFIGDERLLIHRADATHTNLLAFIAGELSRSGFDTVVYTTNIGDWVSGYCTQFARPIAYAFYAESIEKFAKPNVPLIVAARAFSSDVKLSAQKVLMTGQMPCADEVVRGWRPRHPLGANVAAQNILSANTAQWASTVAAGVLFAKLTDLSQPFEVTDLFRLWDTRGLQHSARYKAAIAALTDLLVQAGFCQSEAREEAKYIMRHPAPNDGSRLAPAVYEALKNYHSPETIEKVRAGVKAITALPLTDKEIAQDAKLLASFRQRMAANEKAGLTWQRSTCGEIGRHLTQTLGERCAFLSSALLEDIATRLADAMRTTGLEVANSLGPVHLSAAVCASLNVDAFAAYMSAEQHALFGPEFEAVKNAAWDFASFYGVLTRLMNRHVPAVVSPEIRVEKGVPRRFRILGDDVRAYYADMLALACRGELNSLTGRPFGPQIQREGPIYFAHAFHHIALATLVTQLETEFAGEECFIINFRRRLPARH